MNRKYIRLVPLMLIIVLLYGGNIIASRSLSTTKDRAQDCATSCVQTRDNTLASCNNLPGERKTRCQNSANAQYDKCVEGCNSGNSGNSGRGSEGGGKKP